MFNQIGFNEVEFNEIAQFFGENDQDAIVFNGYSLQNSDVVSSILLQDSMPARDFLTTKKSREHGAFVVGDYFRQKTIKINGTIHKTTSADLEAELDLMKKSLRTREANLDIKINGVIRRYVATLAPSNNIFERRQGFHITVCPFDLVFVCLDPFGYPTKYASRGFIDKTSLDFTEQIVNEGTVEAKPILVLNFSAADNITQIKFTNTTTGESMTLAENISANDYVKFNSEDKTVSINGVEQDYSGMFPDLIAGANTLNVLLTGTSATYTMTLKHKTPYL